MGKLTLFGFWIFWSSTSVKVPPHLIRNRQFLFFFLPPPFRILGQWEGKRTIKEKGSSFTKVCTWGMNFQWDTTNICTFYFELKSKNNLCSIILVIEWSHFPSIENEGESLILWHKGLLYKGKKEGWGLPIKPFLVAEKWKTCWASPGVFAKCWELCGLPSHMRQRSLNSKTPKK